MWLEGRAGLEMTCYPFPCSFLVHSCTLVLFVYSLYTLVHLYKCSFLVHSCRIGFEIGNSRDGRFLLIQLVICC